MKKLFLCTLFIVLLSFQQASAQVRVSWFTAIHSEQVSNIVEQYNNSQHDIELELVTVPSYSEFLVKLHGMIEAGGEVPDIVGPIGSEAFMEFSAMGAFLDLQPLMKEYNYKLDDFDERLLEFYQTENGGRAGLPLTIIPPLMVVNKDFFTDLFDKSPQFPVAFDEPYITQNGEELPWDVTTLKRIREELTEKGSKNAVTGSSCPDDSLTRFYNGEVALLFTHPGIIPALMKKAHMKWDIAVVPNEQEKILGKTDVGSLHIMRKTPVPDEAFKVLRYLSEDAAEEFSQLYNTLIPARKSLQYSFVEQLKADYPDREINWEVILNSLTVYKLRNQTPEEDCCDECIQCGCDKKIKDCDECNKLEGCEDCEE